MRSDLEKKFDEEFGYKDDHFSDIVNEAFEILPEFGAVLKEMAEKMIVRTKNIKSFIDTHYIAKEEVEIEGAYVKKEHVLSWFKIPIKQIDIGKFNCNVCGGDLYRIRGRYPKDEKRDVCPTCAVEVLESITNNLQVSANKSTS